MQPLNYQKLYYFRFLNNLWVYGTENGIPINFVF